MRRFPPAVLCVGVLCSTVPVHATAIPRRSAERAQLMDRWRVELSRADVAAAEERYEDAATGFRSVIEEAQTAAPENLLLARAIDGLADLYRVQRRWAEAIPLYQRSAVMWERLLGPDQPRLATTLQNLAVVYFSQERFDDAEPLLVRAAAIFERSFGAGSVQADAAREVLRIVRKKQTRH